MDPHESHFITDSPVRFSDVPGRILRARRAHEEGRAGYWAIEWQSSPGTPPLPQGRFVGFVALHAPRSDLPALSYAVSGDARRRGVAFEAVGGVIRHCFEDLNVPRLRASTHLDNRASAALLERLGFVERARVETAAGPRRAFVLERAP